MEYKIKRSFNGRDWDLLVKGDKYDFWHIDHIYSRKRDAQKALYALKHGYDRILIGAYGVNMAIDSMTGKEIHFEEKTTKLLDL